jgi:hypothetical protein
MPQSAHPVHSASAHRGWCSIETCVDVARNQDGTVTFTSTIPENTDSITYTGPEWETFREETKLGKWDHI